MHFAFTDTQLEFRDTVRQVVAKECTPDDVRAAYAAPAARTPRWATLADLGVAGLTVPEAHGGLGLGLVDLVLLAEEAGRVALPEPLVATTGLAAPLLADLAASGAAGARIGPWLDAIAAGDLVAAVADPARPSGPVAGADGADLLLLVADGPDGPELHGLDAASVTVTPVPSLDPTRRMGTPVWTPSPGTVLVPGAGAAARLAVTADRAAVATGAELLGLADAMVARTAAYAKDRQQFGRPIGSFQAVKHLLAGAQVLLEFARPVVYGAAWALDTGDAHASRAASAAKARASDAAAEAARVSLQVHGAIGYTWECDLHLYLKRTWALAEAWGSAADHRARLLDSLLAER
ncbi:MAG TPA: acyl-CoA dehydrogenase family protein [Acidimicrobiales bacterium]|nr:acyl-CoA dehydrogenase family protein [Acidimicrobiales bacterium]